MTPEETKRMKELCQAIQSEKNQEQFNALVHELNELIAKKEFRLTQNHPSTKS